MRKLMWFAIGFAIACGFGAYLKYGICAATVLICLLGVCALFSKFRRAVLCTMLGCVIGIGWFLCFDWLYLAPVRALDGQTKLLEITVTDYSRSSEYGVTAEGKAEIEGKGYAVQFYMNQDVSLSPGDHVSGGFRLRYTGGGAEKPTYHQGKGIFLLAYPKGTTTVSSDDAAPVQYVAPMLRQRILLLLDSIFPEDARAFARALLLGDTRNMPFGTQWALQTSGIYHIAAVSGMHVSILFAMLYMLCFRKRVLTAFVGLPLLVLFAAVAGFSPSIVRACIMQALVVLALLVNMEYDPPTALGAAVLCILAANPVGITSVGFQLSVGCMAGIFLFTKSIYRYLISKSPVKSGKDKSIRARLIRWVAGSVSMTLGAISLTTPLSAFYFGSVSLSGILTNLLTLWLVSLTFYAMVVACLLGAVWLPFGVCLGWVIAWPIRLILWVTNMISRVPLSSVYTNSIYIVAWVVFVYILITVFWKNKKKYPVVFIACILAGFMGSVACSWAEPRLDQYRITAVDVGQGQCLLLQNDGKYYMVDCGGDSGDSAATEAIQLLHSQGIFRLDGLILTHYDADHVGGVEQLLSVVPVKTLYLPMQDEENKYLDALTQRYADKIRWIDSDLCIEVANITIFASDNTANSNESSLCVLFQPENCDILITGDRSIESEKELLSRVTLPDLEILVAGHHGSGTSTSWELLNATRPEIVIISVGEDNRYGHPAWETLERLSLFGCSVYRTDTEGTIIFRG